MTKQLTNKVPAMSEKEWSKQFKQLFEMLGWEKSYHTLNSFGSAKGYPDWHLVRVRNGVAESVFVELKSAIGKVKPEQQEWIDVLNMVPGTRAFVWRPADWNAVVKELSAQNIDSKAKSE